MCFILVQVQEGFRGIPNMLMVRKIFRLVLFTLFVGSCFYAVATVHYNRGYEKGFKEGSLAGAAYAWDKGYEMGLRQQCIPDGD